MHHHHVVLRPIACGDAQCCPDQSTRRCTGRGYVSPRHVVVVKQYDLLVVTVTRGKLLVNICAGGQGTIAVWGKEMVAEEWSQLDVLVRQETWKGSDLDGMLEG